ncbi:MAG: anthranilate phosphoribosyltransferase [Kangiellaceae bacterium]|nr:anthranilate phosphoribosyltransferase [Kangiellaceae bacterium]
MNSIQQKLFENKHLTQSEAAEIFTLLIQGELSEIEMTSLLVSLKMKSEQPEEIAGAAQALRQNAISFVATEYATADSCGTGGSGMNTVNISTMVAFVLAELGLPMVKHGNRSISSKCGSADVLENLGVKIDMQPTDARKCLDETNFCFLFAPLYHPGVGNVMPIRNQLKTRTIFNMLGPLINPASPVYQLMGSYSPNLCYPAAQTLNISGCKAAMVVHSNGYDEITLHSPTQVVELSEGKLHSYSLDHTNFNLPKTRELDIGGGTPELNAKLFVDVLKGDVKANKQQSIANTVAANAGALLKISHKAEDLIDGTNQALGIIKSGKAFQRLLQVSHFSKELGSSKK